MPYLGNRVKDSLIRRDVSGGRDGAPLSPGVGHNLKIQSDREWISHSVQRLYKCLIKYQLTAKGYNGCQVKAYRNTANDTDLLMITISGTESMQMYTKKSLVSVRICKDIHMSFLPVVAEFAFYLNTTI